MAASSRSEQFVQLHKALKKSYKAHAPDPEMPLLECLLFAACLENTPYDHARRAYDGLKREFFDWNEVRVSTIRDLAEVLADLPEANVAAGHIKATLQHVFESRYEFDLEPLRKENLKVAAAELENIQGADAFMVSCTVQWALGGHSIPLDRGALTVLHLLGLAREEDVKAAHVPGLERAIPKSKGGEFGSLLHELGAAFIANPYAPAVRKFITDLRPEATELLPQRRSAKARKAAKEQARSERQAKARQRRRKTDQVAEADETSPPEKAASKRTGKKKAAASESADAPSKRKSKNTSPKKATGKRSSRAETSKSDKAKKATKKKKSGKAAGRSGSKPKPR